MGKPPSPASKYLTAGAILHQNIPYKTSQGKVLNLDIYAPPCGDAVLFPAVVFVHGGAWTRGDRSSILHYHRPFILNKLLQEGYVVFSIDYSLINAENIHFPAPITDCKDAVRWIRKNAADYHIDSSRIGVWGVSAGAHLAMLAAYSGEDQFEGTEGLRGFSAEVTFVINHFGPTDLNKLLRPNLHRSAETMLHYLSRQTSLSRKETLKAMTGLDVHREKQEVIERCTRYSPVSYVKGTSTPTLILHGTRDETVPLRQSKDLVLLLNKHGVKHQLMVCAGLNHGFKNADEATMLHHAGSILAFIKSHTH